MYYLVHLAAAVPTRPDYGLTNGDEPINHNLMMESSMMTANQVVMSNRKFHYSLRTKSEP